MKESVQLFVQAMQWRKANDVNNIIANFEASPYYSLLMSYWPASVMWKVITIEGLYFFCFVFLPFFEDEIFFFLFLTFLCLRIRIVTIGHSTTRQWPSTWQAKSIRSF